MEKPDKRVEHFINRHHVLTLATCVDEEAWCAHCFYAYLPESVSFVFTSDTSTKHMQQVCHNCYVAGGIAVESRVIGRLRGLQFQGVVTPVGEEMHKAAERAYLRRFPVAKLMETKLWLLDLTVIKYTDNRLGFGKKIHWQREDPLASVLSSIAAKGQGKL